MLTKKKLTIGLLSSGTALAAGVALLSSNGTLARWTDSVSLPEVTVNSGTLRSAAVGGLTWKNTATGATIDPATYRISPKDVLEGTQNVDVALDGDTLKAQVNVSGTAAGELISTDNLNGVVLTYAVTDKGGTVLSTGTVGSAGTPFTLDESKVGASLDGTQDLTVKIRAEFLDTTSGTNKTQQSLNLTGFAVKVVQI